MIGMAKCAGVVLSRGMRAQRLLFSIAAFWLAGASAFGAPGASVLDATQRCGPRDACLDFNVAIADMEVRRVKGSVSRQPSCGLEVIRMTGRLSRGPKRTYAVAIEGDCMPCSEGWVAYLGRSKANNPIIRTTAGPLEVIDGGVTIGAEETVVLDEKRGSIVAKYLTPIGGAGGFFGEGKETFVRREGGQCFVAPTVSPGLLVLAPDHCKKREEGAWVPFADISPASQRALRRLKLPYPVDTVSVERNPRVGLIALNLSDNCYQ